MNRPSSFTTRSWRSRGGTALVRPDARPQHLRTALAGLDVRQRALGDGPDRDRVSAPRADVGRRCAIASGARVRHRELLVRRPRARTISTALAAAILDDLGDRAAGVVPRLRAPRRQAAAVHVAADRARGRRPASRRRRAGASISSDPALTIHIEMLPDHAFYFFGKEPGAGGLPTGTGGRVACLLSGGIDSPVAAYRMMRRGCSVLFIHFHSYPILSRASQEKVREIAALLTQLSAALAAACWCRSASCSSRCCSPSGRSCASSSTGG